MTQYNERLNDLIKEAFAGKKRIRKTAIIETLAETVEERNRNRRYKTKTKYYRIERVVTLMRAYHGFKKEGEYYVRCLNEDETMEG